MDRQGNILTGKENEFLRRFGKGFGKGRRGPEGNVK